MTIEAQIANVVVGLIGKRLFYRELTNNPAAEKEARARRIRRVSAQHAKRTRGKATKRLPKGGITIVVSGPSKAR